MTGVFDHPWLGGLFADEHMARIWSADQQMRYLLMFEAAHARALGAVGLVPVSTANRAVEQILSFSPDLGDVRKGTAQDGVPIPSLVAQLRQATGESWIHQGATSQDALDTALALTLRATSDVIDARLNAVLTALDMLIDRFGTNTIMARTRMQAALPISVADRLMTWSDPIRRHKARLVHARAGVEQIQFGGAVGTREAVRPYGDAIAADIAQQLNLSNPMKAWHVMRDGVADYATLLSLITGTLGKMGQDICLMAQQGIDDIKLRSGGVSSAMPHKQNPVLAELMVTLAAFNATQLSGIHHAIVQEQERSGAAWALEWMILPQMAQATTRSLSVSVQICDQIQIIGT